MKFVHLINHHKMQFMCSMRRVRTDDSHTNDAIALRVVCNEPHHSPIPILFLKIEKK